MPRGTFGREDDEFEEDDLLDDPDGYDPDDPEYDEEDEEEEGEPDVRSLVAREVNRVKSQLGDARQADRAALQAQGLDLRNGQVVIVDPARAAAMLGTANPGGSAGGKKDEEQEEQLGEMPDPSTFPEEFAAWLEARDAIREKKLTGTFQKQLGALADPVSDRQFDRVMDRCEAVLEGTPFESVLDHPQFEEALQAALKGSGVALKDWTDPTLLKRVAAVLSVDLPPVERRRRSSRRDEDEPRSRRDRRDREEEREPRRPANRRTRREAEMDDEELETRTRQIARGAVSRNSYVQTGTSRGGGRRGNDEYTPEERQGARAMGMTARQFRALGDPNGTDYINDRRREIAAEAQRATRRPSSRTRRGN